MKRLRFIYPIEYGAWTDCSKTDFFIFLIAHSVHGTFVSLVTKWSYTLKHCMYIPHGRGANKGKQLISSVFFLKSFLEPLPSDFYSHILGKTYSPVTSTFQAARANEYFTLSTDVLEVERVKIWCSMASLWLNHSINLSCCFFFNLLIRLGT